MELSEIILALNQRQLLVRIRKPVSTRYEIATLIKLLKGKPVFFENVVGFDMPVISNICATRELVCMGLGIEKKDLLITLARAIDNPQKYTVQPAALHGYRELPCDLTKLPILTYYPQDGGPFIASGIAFANDSEYGINASYHRAMILDEQRMAMRIVERHLHTFMQRGLKEFAFCIGNPTSILLAGAMSVELGKSELEIATGLCPTQMIEIAGHVVPASDLILIAEFTGELANEGPFLDLTETFDIVRKQPVARIKHIFAKPNAVFHALLPGDLEHKLLMGMPREPTVFKEVSKVCECLDVYITPGGCSWLHGAVKIRKHNEDDGKRAISAAFAGHPSMKHVFVVDEDIDIANPLEIEWAMATRLQGDRGLVIQPHQKGSSLDPSSDMDTKETTKVGFDLTRPLQTTGKEFVRPDLPVSIRLEDYLS